MTNGNEDEAIREAESPVPESMPIHRRELREMTGHFKRALQEKESMAGTIQRLNQQIVERSAAEREAHRTVLTAQKDAAFYKALLIKIMDLDRSHCE